MIILIVLITLTIGKSSEASIKARIFVSKVALLFAGLLAAFAFIIPRCPPSSLVSPKRGAGAGV